MLLQFFVVETANGDPAENFRKFNFPAEIDITGLVDAENRGFCVLCIVFSVLRLLEPLEPNLISEKLRKDHINNIIGTR